jgi:hypothetical protein
LYIHLPGQIDIYPPFKKIQSQRGVLQFSTVVIDAQDNLCGFAGIEWQPLSVIVRIGVSVFVTPVTLFRTLFVVQLAPYFLAPFIAKHMAVKVGLDAFDLGPGITLRPLR